MAVVEGMIFVLGECSGGVDGVEGRNWGWPGLAFARADPS